MKKFTLDKLKIMYNTRKEALIREKQLKSFQGRKFIKGIMMGR